MRDLITAVLSFFYLILFFVYLYYAWQTIEWFKYKYMGVRMEIYGDTWEYYITKFFLGDSTWMVDYYYIFCIPVVKQQV